MMENDSPLKQGSRRNIAVNIVDHQYAANSTNTGQNTNTLNIFNSSCQNSTTNQQSQQAQATVNKRNKQVVMQADIIAQAGVSGGEQPTLIMSP